jgi:HYDIN/CFA65/VesB-like, Ig-like domain
MGRHDRQHPRTAQYTEILPVIQFANFRLCGSDAERLVLSAIAIAFAPCACHRADKNRAAPSASAAAVYAGPRLNVQSESIELGPDFQGQTLERRVTVTNIGEGTLSIGQVDSSRSCRGRIEPPAIEPGKSAQLTVNCQTDLYDFGVENLTIHSNDLSAPETRVQLTANIAKLLAFNTQFVELKMPFGETRSEDVHLVGALLKKVHVQLIGAAALDVDITPLPPRADNAPAYRIHCRGQRVGMNSGSLIISTGLERPKTLALPYSCKVAGTLEISPANPYFNLRVSGDKAVTIQVRSSQPGFEVQAARITKGPFAATFERDQAGNGYLVRVTLLSDQLNDEARFASGALLIVSNDRAEPRKEVPLFGFGRVNKVTAKDIDLP